MSMSHADRRVGAAVVALTVAAVAGIAFGGVSLVALGLGAEGGRLPAATVLGPVGWAAIAAIPVGFFFGFKWPRLSWLWGLILGWAPLAVSASLVAACGASCASPTDVVLFLLPSALVVVLGTSAATGAFARRGAA
jgi:hypothetical protein